METAPLNVDTANSPERIPLSWASAVLLAGSLGLCAGYFELLLMVLMQHFWDDEGYVRTGRDFLWTVPLGDAILLVIAAALLFIAFRIRRRSLSVNLGSKLFASLAIWAVLLRLPLYGVATLLLAAGAGGLCARPVAALTAPPRRARSLFVGLLGVLALLGVVSSGRQWAQETRAVSGLVAPPPGARNVVLIVWDTVRAYNVTTNRYPRPTTPNLERWAKQGVQYPVAVAPAPWTYPSHSSFLTGQWPYKLNSQWKHVLDSPEPTVAEYLTSKGYQTAGFSANTNYCNYETGLDRGFSHFEDFTLTPQTFVGRTAFGHWVLDSILNYIDVYSLKWFRLSSRDARGINKAFLDWLRGRRRDRPFFAFLNYFDAHVPYVPPPAFRARFGISPQSSRDYQMLVNFEFVDKEKVPVRDILMNRDCYDDCIAFLDEQLGKLLDELHRQHLLDSTLVIITSDHGEAFGDHLVFGHGNSLHLDEIAVPLVILSPGAPPAAPSARRSVSGTCLQPSSTRSASQTGRHSRAIRWRRTGGSHPGTNPRQSARPSPSRRRQPRTTRTPRMARA